MSGYSKNKTERKEGFTHIELRKKYHRAVGDEGFLCEKRFNMSFYEPLPLGKPLPFFVSTGGFCRVLKIFSQICHKVLTFAGNRTIMKTTFFETEKSCLRSVGIRRKRRRRPRAIDRRVNAEKKAGKRSPGTGFESGTARRTRDVDAAFRTVHGDFFFQKDSLCKAEVSFR